MEQNEKTREMEKRRHDMIDFIELLFAIAGGMFFAAALMVSLPLALCVGGVELLIVGGVLLAILFRPLRRKE